MASTFYGIKMQATILIAFKSFFSYTREKDNIIDKWF